MSQALTSEPATAVAVHAAPAGPSSASGRGDLRAVLQAVGSVVAPTSLLTALLFYFGWAHTYWFHQHFGIDISLLGFGTQDYLMRSVDTLFLPLTVLAAMAGLFLWGHTAMERWLSGSERGRGALRSLSGLLSGGGLALVMIGLGGLFLPPGLLYGLSLSAGALAFAYGSYLKRRFPGVSAEFPGSADRTRLARVSATFILVALGLFWAAANYASSLGETRADTFEATLPGLPAAYLHSKEPLGIAAPGVVEDACPTGEGFRYRYRGLRLLTQAADRYFLLPESWSPSTGMAIVIPANGSVWMQFRAPNQVASPGAAPQKLSCPDAPPPA